MPEEERYEALRLLKALADETRLRILGLLAQCGELSVGDLARRLNLKDPTVSHHLTVLRDLDLVAVRAQGTTHYYAFVADALREKSRTALSPERVLQFADAGSFTAMDRPKADERNVLRDFLDGTTLRQIPASRKKRQVILRYLLQDFEPGGTYTEAEVNERLRSHHPDFATLRREFVASRLMARDHNLYWRTDDPLETPQSEPDEA